jgi:hypothetical protein
MCVRIRIAATRRTPDASGFPHIFFTKAKSGRFWSGVGRHIDRDDGAASRVARASESQYSAARIARSNGADRMAIQKTSGEQGRSQCARRLM